MKITLNKILTIISVTSVLASPMTHAEAEPGQIHFEGAVTATPCGIVPESLNQVVPFGQVSQANLLNGGASQRQDFEIRLVNCTFGPDDNKKVSITFSGNTTSGFANELKTIGGSGDTVVKLYDNNDNLVDFDVPLADVDLVAGNSNQNILHFSAEVAMSKQDGATVKEGEFEATSTFTLDYN